MDMGCLSGSRDGRLGLGRYAGRRVSQEARGSFRLIPSTLETMMTTRYLSQLLGIELPIVQAPMAGVSSPAMAATVSNAGALGSIGVGATDAAGAQGMIAEVRGRTAKPFNVNLFCHRPAVADVALEREWIDRFRPLFAEQGAEPPDRLTEIYQSFVTDEAMLAMLIAERPAVVSFHFGLPPAHA